MTSILIVDDSPTIRRMVRVSLERLPRVRISEAGTGLEAIESLVVSPSDLVILDLNMPDMHGLEVLKFVRARAAFAKMPIIVLTTRGDEASRGAAMAAGATLFRTKPFSPQTLADDVARLLERGSSVGTVGELS